MLLSSFMIDRTGKIGYFDRSIEAAESILSQQETIKNLGSELVYRLSSLLGRIVPIVSEQDASRMPRILDADTIPFVVVNRNESYFFDLGNDQMSTAQRYSASRVIDSWGPRSKSSEEILDDLGKLSLNNRAGRMPISIFEQEGGAVSGVRIIFNSMSLKRALDLNRTPAGKIARFNLRPLIKFPHRPGAGHIDSDVLLHELTHLKQKEDCPITMFSSQDDADMLALGDELEAYHVGAGVRMALDGSDLFDTNVSDPYLQKSVEAIRLKYGNNPLNNPFRPTRRLLEIYQREGYHPDWMLAYRLRYNESIKNLGSAGLSLAGVNATSTRARNGRYTPPRNKSLA